MREEIEYETYIDKQGRVERTTRLYFKTKFPLILT